MPKLKIPKKLSLSEQAEFLTTSFADISARTTEYIDSGGRLGVTKSKKKSAGSAMAAAQADSLAAQSGASSADRRRIADSFKYERNYGNGAVGAKDLVRDLTQFQGLVNKLNTKKNQSGFGLADKFLNDSEDLINTLAPSKGKPVIKDVFKARSEGLSNKQNKRNATVATSLAKSRNAVAARRNRTQIPGSSSDLRKRTNTLFSTERKGTLI